MGMTMDYDCPLRMPWQIRAAQLGEPVFTRVPRHVLIKDIDWSRQPDDRPPDWHLALVEDAGRPFRRHRRESR